MKNHTNATPTSTPHRLHDRLNTDRDSVERDLMKLVLTIIELLRQLMEKQALRRVEQGGLTDEQEERLGQTLMLLEDSLNELTDRYDLTPDDLNLDLGPLGPLLPRT
jgi:Gas vesicle protein K